MADAKLTVQIDGKDNLSGELKHIESSVIRFVGAVSSALTVLSGIAFPIVEAARFQKELRNAAKTTDFSRENLLTLKEGLRDLSKQIDVTAVDLAKIATMGGQIGIGSRGPQALLEFTKVIATAVTALDIGAEEVVASFGKLVNIFDIQPTEFRNAMSSLNQVSNVSNATAEQLFDVVRRVGNLGGSLELPEAVALSATLIDLGITAETAGTSLTKIFADFKSNAKEFASLTSGVVVDATGEAIKTTEDFVRLVESDGLSALTAYLDGLNRLDTVEASATKSRLTGEGRLFEVISKLQEQRRRQVVLAQKAEKAEAALARAQQRGAPASEIEALNVRKESLKLAAEQASVLSRLTKEARTAFTVGDSAEKEQQTILGALTSQFDVFVNNIKALGATVGDVFLLPLTQGLSGASKSLSSAFNTDSLRQAAEDILATIRNVKEGVAEVFSFFGNLEGTGVDWGAALRLSALLISFAVFKGFAAILRAVSGNMLALVPGATALSAALFGTARATEAASAAAAAANGQDLSRAASLQRLTSLQAKINAQLAAYSVAVAAQRAAEAKGLAAEAAGQTAVATSARRAAAQHQRAAEAARLSVASLNREYDTLLSSTQAANGAGATRFVQMQRLAVLQANISDSTAAYTRAITLQRAAQAQATAAAIAGQTRVAAAAQAVATEQATAATAARVSVSTLTREYERLTASAAAARAAGTAGAASLSAVGAATSQYGGIVGLVSTAFSNFVLKVVNDSQRIVAAQTRINAAIGAAQSRIAAGQARINALFAQPRLGRLQTLPALLAAITVQQQRLSAAQAAGQSTRGIQGNITFLQRQAAEIQALEARVQNLTGRLAGLQGALSRVGGVSPFASLRAQLASLVTQAGAAGTRAGASLAAGFRQGASVGAVSLVSSYATSVFVPLVARARATAIQVSTALAGAFTSVTQAARRVGPAVSSGFSGIQAAATRARAAVVGLAASVKALGVAGAAGAATGGIAGLVGAAAGGITSGVAQAVGAATKGLVGFFRSLSVWVATGIIEATGWGAAWGRASTRVARSLVVLRAGFTLLGRAISGVTKLAGRLFSFAFIAIMIVDVLKAIGLWEKFAGVVRRALDFYNSIAPKSLQLDVPDFLKDPGELRRESEAVDAIKHSMEAAAAQASRFTDAMKASVAVAGQLDVLRDDLTFTATDPEAAQKSLKEYIDSLFIAYSRVGQLNGALALAERDLLKAQELAQRPAEPKLQEARQSDVARLEGRVAKINAELKVLDKLSEKVKNAISLGFAPDEGEQVFARSLDGGISRYEALIALQIKLNDLTQEQARLASTIEKGRTEESVDSQVETALDNQKRVTDEIAATKKALAEVGAGFLAAGQNSKVLYDNIRGNTDNAALREQAKLVDDLAVSFDGFEGLTLPKLDANDIFSSVASFEVSRRVSDMYKSLAETAKAEADRATRYVKQAIGEVERLAKNARASVDAISKNTVALKDKAANQIQDKADDATSRARLQRLQTQYDVERALLEQLFDKQRTIFDDQTAFSVGISIQKERQYASEQRALFQLEEKYKKLRDLEQERLDLKRAQRGAEQEIKQFNELIKQVDHYKKAVEAANKILLNPESTLDQQRGAIARREDAVNKLRSSYSLLESSLQSIANKEPIEGKLIVAPAKLEQMKAQFLQVSDLIGGVILKDASALEEGTGRIAKGLSLLSERFGSEAGAAFGRFQAFVQQAAKESGKSSDEIAKSVASVIVQSSSFQKTIDSIDKFGLDSLIDPSSAQAQEFAKSISAVREALSDTFGPGALDDLDLSLDQTLLREELLKGLEGELKQRKSGASASVGVSLEEGAGAQLKADVAEIAKEASTTVVMTLDTRQLVQTAVGSELRAVKETAGAPITVVATLNTDDITQGVSEFRKEVQPLDRALIYKPALDPTEAKTEGERLAQQLNEKFARETATIKPKLSPVAPSAVAQVVSKAQEVFNARRPIVKPKVDPTVTKEDLEWTKVLAKEGNKALDKSVAIAPEVDLSGLETAVNDGVRSFSDVELTIKAKAEIEAREKDDALARLAKDLTEEFGGVKITPKVETGDFVRQINEEVKGLEIAPKVNPAETQAQIEAQVHPNLTPLLNTDAMQSQIEQNVQPKLEGTLKITNVEGAANLSVKVTGRRRGGLVEDIASLGASISRFAGGGKVRGPGGGTDDRVLSLLSSGEYVMDALTTARFGPKFFSTLQKAARGGLSATFLRNLTIPQFAYGGFVGADQALAFSGIANDFKNSESSRVPQDTMEVILAHGGQRATIQAEREQAKTLVGILRNFEKGR